MKYNSPKGTRDLIGADFYQIDYISKTILEVLESFAYKQVRTPNFETLELLQKDSGEEMLEQIYSFTDKGGRKFGLKSDITPALTRIVSEIGTSAIRPIKLCTYDRVYRYERPQSGRYREITQINGELFGSSQAISDAECISTLIACYEKLKFYNFKIVIGYRPILLEFLKEVKVEEDKILSVVRLIDKRKKIDAKEFVNEVLKLSPTLDLQRFNEFLKLNGSPKEVLKEAKNLFDSNNKVRVYLDNLSEIIDELELMDILKYCEIDFGLARGSAYYTGIIFEAMSTKVTNFGSIGAGGRYDNLVSMYGGKDIAAVGFSIGLDRLALLLKTEGLLNETEETTSNDYFIAFEKDSISKRMAYKLACELRDQKKKVELDLMGKNLSEQLTTAKRKSEYGIIIRSDLAKENKYKVINFLDSSEKIEVAI